MVHEEASETSIAKLENYRQHIILQHSPSYSYVTRFFLKIRAILTLLRTSNFEIIIIKKIS